MCGAGNDCRQYSRERLRADRASRRRGRRAGARRQPFHRVPARPVRRFNRRRRFAPPTDDRHRSSHAVHLWGSARHHLSCPVTHPASRQRRFDGVCSRPRRNALSCSAGSWDRERGSAIAREFDKRFWSQLATVRAEGIRNVSLRQIEQVVAARRIPGHVPAAVRLSPRRAFQPTQLCRVASTPGEGQQRLLRQGPGRCHPCYSPDCWRHRISATNPIWNPP